MLINTLIADTKAKKQTVAIVDMVNIIVMYSGVCFEQKEVIRVRTQELFKADRKCCLKR